MTTTPLPPPITKYSEPMLKNWPWTEAELAWVAARDAQWQAYTAAARADLEAEVARLREALSACQDAAGDPKVVYKTARAALENRP